MFVFKTDNSLIGEIRLNFGGVKVLERSFTGTYTITPRHDLGAITGDIDFTLSPEDPVAPNQNQAIYFVMRNTEEMAFLLIEAETSVDPDPCDEIPPVVFKNAGAAAVHGTLKKIAPIESFQT